MATRGPRLALAVIVFGALFLLLLVVRGQRQSETSARVEVGRPVRGVAALIDARTPPNDIFNGQFCGAAMIQPRLAVTAAHCIEDRDQSELAIVAGADNLCRNRPIDGERRKVVSVVIAPTYQREPLVHDVALLVLETPVHVGVLPILQRAPFEGSSAIAYGWGGTTAGGIPACRLQAVDLTVSSTAACEGLLGRGGIGPELVSSFVCAAPRIGLSGNICRGDSGGPLIADDRIVALVSWGLECQGTGAYVRLEAEGHWLNDALLRAEDGLL